jgi:tripartite-type tricarboxylate transporter receptor subunit TctC
MGSLGHVLRTLGVLPLLAFGSAAGAQEYPERPVTIIVPFGAGGGVDVGARNLADGLSRLWDQPVVVENRPGAGSQIGTGAVAEADPTGYTLLYISAAFTTLPATNAFLPYDPVEDFVPVASAGQALIVLGVGPGVKATTVAELVEESKSRQMFYTTSGAGSSSHLLSEALKAATGADLQAVHYKGNPEAAVDVAAGRADVYVNVPTGLEALLAEGKIRLLATMGDKRSNAYPDVPTLIELGYESGQLSAWWGVFAPAGTPEAVVERINAGVNEVLQDPAYQTFFENNGAAFEPRTSEAFAANVLEEMSFWKKIASDNGLVQ